MALATNLDGLEGSAFKTEGRLRLVGEPWNLSGRAIDNNVPEIWNVFELRHLGRKQTVNDNCFHVVRLLS
jgi:hypothetical protein